MSLTDWKPTKGVFEREDDYKIRLREWENREANRHKIFAPHTGGSGSRPGSNHDNGCGEILGIFVLIVIIALILFAVGALVIAFIVPILVSIIVTVIAAVIGYFWCTRIWRFHKVAFEKTSDAIAEMTSEFIGNANESQSVLGKILFRLVAILVFIIGMATYWIISISIMLVPIFFLVVTYIELVAAAFSELS